MASISFINSDGRFGSSFMRCSIQRDDGSDYRSADGVQAYIHKDGIDERFSKFIITAAVYYDTMNTTYLNTMNSTYKDTPVTIFCGITTEYYNRKNTASANAIAVTSDSHAIPVYNGYSQETQSIAATPDTLNSHSVKFTFIFDNCADIDLSSLDSLYFLFWLGGDHDCPYYGAYLKFGCSTRINDDTFGQRCGKDFINGAWTYYYLVDGYGISYIEDTSLRIYTNNSDISAGSVLQIHFTNRNNRAIDVLFKCGDEILASETFNSDDVDYICPVSWMSDDEGILSKNKTIIIYATDNDDSEAERSFELSSLDIGIQCDKTNTLEGGTITLTSAGRMGLPLHLTVKHDEITVYDDTIESDTATLTCDASWYNMVGDFDTDTLPFTATVEDEYGRTASCNFTVTSKPEIVVQPADLSVGDGHEATFEIIAQRGTIRYQWQYSDDGIAWRNITNGKSETLSLTAALSQDGMQYRCIVSNSIGSVTSESAILHVLEVPVIHEQPQTVTVLPGTEIGFSVSATGGMLTYQWQRMEQGTDVWTDLPGEAGASIEKSALDTDDGAQYRCVISNDIDDTISQAAAIQIIRVPSIDDDITSVTVTEGDDVRLAMQVSGYHLQYQWEKSADGSTWTTLDEDADTLQFTALKAESGCQYRCTVSNEAGSSTSNTVSVTVLLKTEITVQPDDAEVAENDGHTFAVSATGEHLQYQWQIMNEGAWEDIDDENTASLSIHAIRAVDGSRYRCAISNEISTVYSDGAFLYVIYPPIITQDPESVNAVVGSEIALSVATENSKPNYQWKQSSDGEIWEDSIFDGAQTKTLHVPSTKENDGLQFKCVVYNIAGEDTTEPAAVRIYLPTVIDRQPVDLSVTAGEIGMLRIEASGEELTFIWQRYDEEAAEWANISDISIDSIGLFVTDQEDNMRYRCVVSNPAETLISDTATIYVLPDVTITGQPVNIQGIVGNEVSFTCEAYGAITAYQWQERSAGGEWMNTMRTGSATPTLSFITDAASDGVQFRCVVTGVYYTATSNVAVLDAVALPQITLQPVGATVMETKQASFSIEATGKYLSYQWQRRATSNDEWSNLTTAGSNSAFINIAATRWLNGYQFRCAVSNIAGTVYSELAVLTVNLTVFKLADEGNGTYRNVLPRGDYIFSPNADRDGVLFSLGFGNEYETTWLCENQETPFAFYSDGTRPIRIFIYDKDGYDLNGCVIQPMLESGFRAHAWVSPVQEPHDIVNDFNYDWFSIGNTYESQENVVTATMPCEMTIRYRPIWKDTL